MVATACALGRAAQFARLCAATGDSTALGGGGGGGGWQRLSSGRWPGFQSPGLLWAARHLRGRAGLLAVTLVLRIFILLFFVLVFLPIGRRRTGFLRRGPQRRPTAILLQL